MHQRHQSTWPQRRLAKRANMLAKYLRLGCVLIMFQTSLFTACTSRLRNAKTRPHTPVGASVSHLSRLANSARARQAFSIYSLVVIVLYAYWSGSSILMDLLDLDALADYRYLDCFWIGKFTLNGRSSMGIKYICLQLALGLLILRFLATFGGDNYYIQAMDFLHRDLADIEQCIQRRDLTRHQMLKPGRVGHLDQDDDGDCDLYYKQYDLSGSDRYGYGYGYGYGCGEVEPSMVRVYMGCELNKGQFEDDVMFAKGSYCSRNHVILRLNRRPSHWLRLTTIVLISTLCSIAILAVWLVGALTLMTPTIVTKRGFEISYLNCIGYIRKYTNSSETRARDFGHIYEVPQQGPSAGEGFKSVLTNYQRLPAILPMENFVTGHYHWMRMSADFLRSVAFFLDAMAYFIACLMLDGQICYDIMINANEIRKRLVRLHTNKCRLLELEKCRFTNDLAGVGRRSLLNAADLKLIKYPGETLVLDAHCRKMGQNHAKASLSLSSGHYGSFNTVRRGSCKPPGQDEYSRSFTETVLLQGLILDHFKLVRNSNACISFHASANIAMWLCINTSALVWLGLTGRRDRVPRELFMLEICVSAILLAHLCALSKIGTVNRKFYPLIASLMALDRACSVTKQRWMAILNYYEPKPLFCFTLISHEISYLLVVKMVAWALSALFVVLSFLVEFK